MNILRHRSPHPHGDSKTVILNVHRCLHRALLWLSSGSALNTADVLRAIEHGRAAIEACWRAVGYGGLWSKACSDFDHLSWGRGAGVVAHE